MTPILRRYTWKLYPNAPQTEALERQLRMSADLWNALLEMRQAHYRRACEKHGSMRFRRWKEAIRREKRLVVVECDAPIIRDKTVKASRTCFDDKKAITELRAACPEWREISVAAARGVAERLDKAYQAAFGRLKKGEDPGFPRFKASKHWSSISFAEKMGSGWALKRAGESKRGGWRLYVKGVPSTIKARGLLPCEPLDWKTGEVIKAVDGWFLSVAVEMPERRNGGAENLRITYDLLDSFARVERADGGCPAGFESDFRIGGEANHPQNSTSSGPPVPDTPDLQGDGNHAMRQPRNRLVPDTPDLQGDGNHLNRWVGSRAVPDTPDLRGDGNQGGRFVITDHVPDTPDLRGERQFDTTLSSGDRRHRKFSWRWRQSRNRAAKIAARKARQNKYRLHVWTTQIVNSAASVEAICPKIKDHTKSAKGDFAEWGGCVETVADLNRNTLSMAPAMSLAMLEYKAAEAGVAFARAEPAETKLSVGSDLPATKKAARKAARKLKECA